MQMWWLAEDDGGKILCKANLTAISRVFIMFSFLFLLVLMDFLYLDSELVSPAFREAIYIRTHTEKGVYVYVKNHMQLLPLHSLKQMCNLSSLILAFISADLFKNL